MSQMSPETAREILRVQAATLESCAAEIDLDLPSVARKWRIQASKNRAALGEPEEDSP